MQEPHPVSIYDTVNKKLIGVFATHTLCSRYLSKVPQAVSAARISTSLHCKSKILKGTIFEIPVTCRVPSVKHIELLSGKRYCILNGYPIPDKRKMEGFTNLENKSS